MTEEAIIYARFSPRKGGEDCESNDVQIARCISYCAARGLDVIAIYRDEEISGRTAISARDEGKKLCEALPKRKVRKGLCIVALKLDRLFRSVTDCLENVELWDKRGIGLHIVDLGGSSIDTRSPTGRFMLTVMAAAAELERGMIAQRTSTAQRHYMFEGRRIMTRKDQCPYGWVIDPQDDTKMVEVPKEQEALRMMVKLRDDGLTYQKVCDRLLELGYPPRTGDEWRPQSLYKMIKRVEREDLFSKRAEGFERQQGDPNWKLAGSDDESTSEDDTPVTTEAE